MFFYGVHRQVVNEELLNYRKWRIIRVPKGLAYGILHGDKCQAIDTTCGYDLCRLKSSML